MTGTGPVTLLAAAGAAPGDGLAVAVALVAVGGLVAMVLRVLRGEAGRRREEPAAPPGYPEDARREHPPVTDRP